MGMLDWLFHKRSTRRASPETTTPVAGADTRWNLLADQALAFAADQQWGLYCNVEIDKADLLRSEGKARQALDQYLWVCFLDLNGPENVLVVGGKLSSRPFRPQSAVLAPVIVDRIAELSRSLPDLDLAARFLEVATRRAFAKMPITPARAWRKLNEALRISMKPEPHVEEATEAQLRYLRKLGVEPAKGISKIDAIDLIGTRLPPEAETVEILRFFKTDLSGMTQTDARHALARLMEEPANRERWKHRPATKEQRECLTFFKQPVPRDLDHAAAELAVSELMEDDAKADAWDKEQERADEIASVRGDANDFASGLGCKKLSAKLCKAALQSLLDEGLTVEQIGRDDFAILFRRAADTESSIVLDPIRFDMCVVQVLSAAADAARKQP